MKPKHVYLIFCAFGVIVPYWQFLPWLNIHGFNVKLFAAELLANRIGGFFAMDVLISAVCLLYFARTNGTRKARWLVLAAILTVGVSLGLPLLLYLREKAAERAVTLAS